MKARVFSVAAMLAACAALMIAVADEADAHAVISSSEPQSGARLERAPDAVALAFTEEIDAGVSSIRVLDTTGRSVTRGNSGLVPGDSKKLKVALADLDEGVYTVTWRVLSKVDGHVTGGAFAFGVGVSPSGFTIPTAEVPETPDATVLSVSSRVLIYAGLILLMGAATAVAVLQSPSRGSSLIAMFGWFALVFGIFLFAQSLRADTGATYSALLATNAGRGMALRLGAAVLIGAALAATQRWRGWWLGVAVLTIGVAGTHVYFGHAGAGSLRFAKVTSQTIHTTAVSIWLGGLSALLIGIRSLEVDQRSRAVRRFSTIAGIALTIVVGTGAFRAFNEVASWGRLTSTGYGRAVLVKVGLALVLAVLGAVNRYRNVPRAGETVRGLRRVGIVELAVALILLVATGFLTSLAPARLVGSSAFGAKPPSVVVERADFATTVRVRLEASPGKPGPNRFAIRLSDYDSKKPIQARRVTLTFRYPVADLIQPSTLELRREKAGVYSAVGPNLAIGGPWLVDVLIVSKNTSTQLTMTLGTISEQSIEAVPGDPTLYNVTIDNVGSVQLYVDPARAGRNEIHATYFDEKGAELGGISDAALVATPSGGDPRVSPIRFLSPGHFIADENLSRGKWRFDAIVTGPSGATIHVYFEHNILAGQGE